MVRINYAQAKEFLDKINEKDNITIFCHTDLDGFASGILFYDFCISRGCKNINVHPISYGINKISDFNLEKVNKILIADLAPSIISEDLTKLKEKEVFYTDHHPEDSKFPLPKEVLELRTTSEGYIPSSRTAYELCGGKKWLSVVGVISDAGDTYKENTEFIESFIKENKKSMEYLKQDVMFTISRAITYFEKHTETSFFEILKNIKYMEDIDLNLKEFEKPVKEEFERYIEIFEKNSEKFGKIVFYEFQPEYNIKSFLITFLSAKEPEKIFIFATPKKEKIISLSARNQSREYDVAMILKNNLKDIPNSSAGGHKAAAGGQIQKSGLDKFKQNLKKYDLEKTRI
jgi:single-stranded DNA-specific DHH superfamily exonuclease